MMTNKQYHFSLAVAVSLLMLGAVVSSLASIGLSLMGLGLAILVLSVLTRPRAEASVQSPSSPVSAPLMR